MKTREHMKLTFERLDQSAQKIVATRGYTKQVNALKALEELIREQLNAYSGSATRTIR